MTNLHQQDRRTSGAATPYTTYLENPNRKRGEPPLYSVRCRATDQIAYGPSPNTIAVTRANMKLNDGTMTPNTSHRKNGHA